MLLVACASQPLTPQEREVQVVADGTTATPVLSTRCESISTLSNIPGDLAARREAIRQGANVVQVISLGSSKNVNSSSRYARRQSLRAARLWKCDPMPHAIRDLARMYEDER